MNAQVERALSEANRMKEVLETTNRDMGLQIQRLEAGRLGGGFNADIPSLQKQNEELTRKKAALEAELSESRKTAEAAATAEREGTLATALSEVEEMRAARSRQEEMVAAIVHQRDVYRELLKSGGSGGQPQAAAAAAAAAAGGGEQLAALQKEFDIYKEEQKAQFKMIEGRLQQTQQSEFNTKKELGTAKSAVENGQQRYGRLQEVLNSKKDELTALEKKQAEYKATIGGLQQKLEGAQASLSEAAETQRRRDAEHSRVKTEHDVAKASEKRLVEERESLKTEKRTQERLVDALQQAVAEKEAALRVLEGKQAGVVERHSKAIADVKEGEEEQRRKASTAMEQLRAVEQELAAAKTAATVSAEQAKTARDKQLDAEQRLAELETNPQPAVSAVVEPTATQLGSPAQASGAGQEAELREAQLKLITLEDELASAKEDVAAKEKAAADYAAIARGHEQTMELQRQKLRTAESTAERRATEVEAAQKEASSLREKLDNAEQTAAAARKGVEDERDTAQAELAAYESTITQLKAEASSTAGTIAALKQDVESHHAQWREARSERLAELQKHSKTAEELQAVSATVASAEAKVKEAESAAATAKAELRSAAETHDSGLSDLQKRLDAALLELADARKDNETLRVQLEKSAENFRFGRRVSDGSDAQLADNAIVTNPVGSSGATGAEGGATALFEVNQQLKKELEIRKADTKVLEEKVKRMGSQSDHLQRELDFARAKLSEEMQRSSRIDINGAELEALRSKASQYDVLKDSNALLRQETGGKDDKIKAFQKQVAEKVARVEQLEQQVGALKAGVRTSSAAVETSKKETAEWRAKAQSIMEKYQRVDLDEYSKMQEELAVLRTQKNEIDEVKAQLAALSDAVDSLRAQSEKMLAEADKADKNHSFTSDNATLEPVVRALNKRLQVIQMLRKQCQGLLQNKNKAEAALKAEKENVAAATAEQTNAKAAATAATAAKAEADKAKAAAEQKVTETEKQLGEAKQMIVSLNGVFCVVKYCADAWPMCTDEAEDDAAEASENAGRSVAPGDGSQRRNGRNVTQSADTEAARRRRHNRVAGNRCRCGIASHSWS